MIFRGVTDSNDWLFGQGIQSYFTKETAINANIKTALQTFYQECFFDPAFGVPWFAILGQKNISLFQVTIQDAILACEGVTKVNLVSFYLDENRVARVKYSVNTIYTIQLEGEVALQ